MPGRVISKKFWENKAEDLLKSWDDQHETCQVGSRLWFKLNDKVNEASTIRLMLNTMDAEIDKALDEVSAKRNTLTSEHMGRMFEMLSAFCKHREAEDLVLDMGPECTHEDHSPNPCQCCIDVCPAFDASQTLTICQREA